MKNYQAGQKLPTVPFEAQYGEVIAANAGTHKLKAILCVLCHQLTDLRNVSARLYSSLRD